MKKILALIVAVLIPSLAVATDKVPTIDSGNTAWVLVSAALVMLMTPGLAFFYAGMVSRKNVVSHPSAKLRCGSRWSELSGW